MGQAPACKVAIWDIVVGPCEKLPHKAAGCECSDDAERPAWKQENVSCIGVDKARFIPAPERATWWAWVIPPEAETSTPCSGMAGMSPTSSDLSSPGSGLRAAGGSAVAEYSLTLRDLLDCFSICSRSLTVLRAAMDCHACPGERARAVAAAAVGVGGGGAELPDAVLPHVLANLTAVGRLPAPLAGALRHALEQSATWIFDGSGSVDTAPRLTCQELLDVRFSQEELADVRRLACAHVPPSKQGYNLVWPLRERQFCGSGSAERPTVVITVGPPGSGKTYLLRERCAPFIQRNFGGPPLDCYVRIDPDYYIGELLENNNNWREMANFLNHESFMCAIGQRRHMLFDHTGKDLANTCGRVVSRLREANYRVYICVVLADFDSCKRRSEDRRRDTGREVPDAYIRLVFEALQKTVPWYLQKQGSIADAVVVYTNNYGTSDEELQPEVVNGGTAPQELVSRVLRLLTVPPAGT